MMVRPRILGSDSMKLDRKVRNYPVDSGETRVVKMNLMHYARQCTVRQVEVPAERFSAVQALIGQIEQDEHSQVAVFYQESRIDVVRNPTYLA